MPTMAERLREARKAAGFQSAAAAARQFGWTPATYRHHENGTRPFDRDYASTYARVYHVNSAWLLGLSDVRSKDKTEELRDILSRDADFYGQLSDLNESLQDELGCYLVRVVEPKDLQSKGPSALFAATSRYVPFQKDLLTSIAKVNFKQIAAMQVESDNMRPTVSKGSLILIDPGHTEPTEHDAIWLFSFGGIVSVRRLRFLSAYECVAIADAAEVPNLSIDTREGQFSIWAKVVWVGQTI